MKIYFTTHATTTDNEEQISSGWKDAGLSELGIQQAKELKDHLKNISFDIICTSDLKRAVDTIKIAFGDSYPVIVDERLRELNYGDYNGKPKSEVGPLKLKYMDDPFPNGESYKQAEKRVQDFYKEMKEKHPYKVLLVVGHIATRFGLVTLTSDTQPKELLDEKFTWQPYWEYEL